MLGDRSRPEFPESPAPVGERASLDRTRGKIEPSEYFIAGEGITRMGYWKDCNSIARCHVCGGPLMFVNKGAKHRPAYYCSNRIRRGNAVCSNTRGALLEALDHAVTVKLADMLNKDFEAVLDLCEQQAAVWRQQRALPKDQRAQWERETKRLEGAINRLLDQIEAGQAVGAVVPNLWGLAVGPSPTEGCCDGRAKAHGWRRRQLACAQYMSPSSQIWPGLRPRSAHLELAYGPGRSPRPVHKVLLVTRNPPA